MAQVLSPETLVYGFSLANDRRISPDGTQVVYTVIRVDRETRRSGSQLWLCDIEGANARQLTRIGERNGGACWSPDGRSVAFISDRAGDSQQSIAVLSLEGGEAREITRHRVPLSGLAWSPDGRTIAYTAIFDPENPDELPTPQDAPPRVRVTRRLDYKQDTRGYLGDARAQVWLVDVETGERRMLTRESVDRFHPA
jgi:Tol biopolymer transport system component